jgi:ferredoxin
MQVMVNPMVCQGHAMCVNLASEVFALAEDSSHRAYVIVEAVPEHLHDSVRHAARCCPEGAIIVAE